MEDSGFWLIGCGPMAQAYAKVLQGTGQAFRVIGRGEQSAKEFEAKVGIGVTTGGVQQALNLLGPPKHALVATGIETLAPLAQTLLEAGTKFILVEKPAGLSATEVDRLAALAANKGSQVFVAYNRRFFASVLEAQRLVEEDGGLLSITFDFTEMADRVGSQDRPQAVKERWLLANSTHVIDLAFHLAGTPVDWCAHRAGELEWHPAGAVFAGAGTTDRGVIFSYTANWTGPGRWGLELVTGKRRIVLRPMERLFGTEAALQQPEEIDIDLSLDQEYKPGLALQVRAFLTGNDPALCTIREHARMMPIYERVAGYA